MEEIEMLRIKKMTASLLLALVVGLCASPCFAGDIQNGIAGPTETPGIAGEMPGPGAMGDILIPGLYMAIASLLG